MEILGLIAVMVVLYVVAGLAAIFGVAARNRTVGSGVPRSEANKQASDTRLGALSCRSACQTRHRMRRAAAPSLVCCLILRGHLDDYGVDSRAHAIGD